LNCSDLEVFDNFLNFFFLPEKFPAYRIGMKGKACLSGMEFEFKVEKKRTSPVVICSLFCGCVKKHKETQNEQLF
jgi:hypothetical protein